MLRVLILARDSNPDKTHGHLIGYSHAEALARLHAVTLVIHRDNEKAVRRAQGRSRPSRRSVFHGSIISTRGAFVGSLEITISARL